MMKLSRLLALPLICALFACSSAPVVPTPAPLPATPVPAPTSAPQPTAQPAVTRVPETPVPPSALVLWAVAEDAELEALRALIADLAQAGGSQVVVVGKTADGLIADARANALAGLPLPDLVWATQDELALLVEDGGLQSADDELDSAAFLPAVIAAGSSQGQRWGTPVAAQGYLLLLYNRKLADSPPRTTDELIARSRQLTRGDQYGLVAAWAEPRWFTAWLNGLGGAPLDQSGAPTLDTPQMVAALNLLRELRASGPPPPSSYQDGVRLFRRGNAAFAIDGDWSLSRYRAYSDTLDLGVAPMPVVPATGRAATSSMGGIYLMYGRALAGPRRERALALGRALTQPAAQTRIARELHRLPALRAALTDPAVTNDPALAAAAAQAAQAPGIPPIQALRCAWNAIRADLPSVILGELAQADAARDMQASAEACVK